jgi:hypothetical protein
LALVHRIVLNSEKEEVVKPLYQPKYLRRCEPDALPSAAGVVVICCEKGNVMELMICQKVDDIKKYASP